MPPMAAVVAMEEPDRAANIMQTASTTMERPPRTWPSSALANCTSRDDMPPCCMMAPASIKKKIASSVYFAPPLYIFCTTVIRGKPLMKHSVQTQEKVRLQAKGTPSSKVTRNKTSKMMMGVVLILS